MKRALARLAALASLIALSACPLPSADTLRAQRGLNASLLVFGAHIGDVLQIEVDDEPLGRAEVVTEEPIVFEARLDVGTHAGAVRAVRRDRVLCAAFVLQVDADADQDEAAVDLRVALDCSDDSDGGSPQGGDGGTAADAGRPDDEDGGGDADDDGGANDEDDDDAGEPDDDAGGDEETDDAGAGSTRLVWFREESHNDGTCVEPCDASTRIEDGSVVFIPPSGGGAAQTGAIDDDMYESFAIVALGEAADVLFAGEDPACPVAAPPGGPTVELRRLIERFDDEGVAEMEEESVVVTGCDDGAAADLRSYVALLRDLAGVGEEP